LLLTHGNFTSTSRARSGVLGDYGCRVETKTRDRAMLPRCLARNLVRIKSVLDVMGANGSHGTYRAIYLFL
jgi:hypothetical protein